MRAGPRIGRNVVERRHGGRSDITVLEKVPSALVQKTTSNAPVTFEGIKHLRDETKRFLSRIRSGSAILSVADSFDQQEIFVGPRQPIQDDNVVSSRSFSSPEPHRLQYFLNSFPLLFPELNRTSPANEASAKLALIGYHHGHPPWLDPDYTREAAGRSQEEPVRVLLSKGSRRNN